MEGSYDGEAFKKKKKKKPLGPIVENLDAGPLGFFMEALGPLWVLCAPLYRRIEGATFFDDIMWPECGLQHALSLRN